MGKKYRIDFTARWGKNGSEKDHTVVAEGRNLKKIVKRVLLRGGVFEKLFPPNAFVSSERRIVLEIRWERLE